MSIQSNKYDDLIAELDTLPPKDGFDKVKELIASYIQQIQDQLININTSVDAETIKTRLVSDKAVHEELVLVLNLIEHIK